ncbi:MAG: hypothetical protein PHF86_01395 [Candidatus Nanoarchaeia archaeon]|nr:hypothetical protein [Candidatus Nanoarchaeia archaeon]
MLDLLLGLTLFGSTILGIALFMFFLFLCFVADVKKDGFIATFSLIVMGVLYYFWGKESWVTLISFISIKSIFLYIGLGFIHAIIRIYFYGREEMKKVNEYRSGGNSYDYSINKNIKSNVFRWWLLWPISFIIWVIQDMVKDIYDWVYNKLDKFFNYIMDLGIKSVPEVPKPEDKSKKFK